MSEDDLGSGAPGAGVVAAMVAGAAYVRLSRISTAPPPLTVVSGGPSGSPPETCTTVSSFSSVRERS